MLGLRLRSFRVLPGGRYAWAVAVRAGEAPHRPGASAQVPRALPLLRDYSAARLCLAEEPAPRGLCRSEPRALRVRRGAGRHHRAEESRARCAELLLARLRQPRRRVALPRALYPARPPGRGAG